jgi:hypothetical protein
VVQHLSLGVDEPSLEHSDRLTLTVEQQDRFVCALERGCLSGVLSSSSALCHLCKLLPSCNSSPSTITKSVLLSFKSTVGFFQPRHTCGALVVRGKNDSLTPCHDFSDKNVAGGESCGVSSASALLFQLVHASEQRGRLLLHAREFT